jgi:hypothetical protein
VVPRLRAVGHAFDEQDQRCAIDASVNHPLAIVGRPLRSNVGCAAETIGELDGADGRDGQGTADDHLIIAPITVALESATMPAVAIAAESASMSQKRVCFAATSPVERWTASRISSGVRPSLVSRLAMLDARGMSLARASTV